jgi:lipopolysaccharide/colanic/teichoic acid biosynthesis glycosyltransferase
MSGATFYERRGRRLLDVLVALSVLLACLPAIALLALAVALRLGAPILYSETRAGRGGRPFVLTKFRTMSNARGADGRLLPDADRLTLFGRVLRRYSLDELPGLLSVLKGEMSLVGPRPLPTRYVERYTPEQARRLEVRPGVTGLAQVSGRNELGWEEKFALDVWYVEHRTLALDLHILWATLRVVLTGYGVSHPGQATMTEFAGSLEQDRA